MEVVFIMSFVWIWVVTTVNVCSQFWGFKKYILASTRPPHLPAHKQEKWTVLYTDCEKRHY